MKVLMINGSPRPDGNTSIALAEMEKTLAEEGVEVETVQVGNKDIRGCIACSSVRSSAECVFDDLVNEVAPQTRRGRRSGRRHARTTGAPTPRQSPFSTGCSTPRGSVDKTMKVGCAVAVARRGGIEATWDEVNKVLRHFGHAHRVGSVLERRIWPREGRGGSRCRGPAADAHART